MIKTIQCLVAMLVAVIVQSGAQTVARKVVIKPSPQVSIADQFNQEGTRFLIRQNLDLRGDTLEMPEHCELLFRGGAIDNGVIVGKHTRISARQKKIFGDSLKLAGTWDVQESHPEWFGAKGDGLSDDTYSIRQAMRAPFNCCVVFQRKTHIVNVTAGTDNDTQRIIFGVCKAPEMKGNGTIIRLGDNDNCNLYSFKGFGAMFSVYSLDSFRVSGITFDFNYGNNPIYQTQGVRQSIQENTQQNAFQFRRVRKVTIDHCTFIGHSGTNCIDYNDARYDEGDKTFEVTISNCQFLQCGGKSYCKDGDTIADAYHDCSTIALHYTGSNHDTPYVVRIKDNYFEGVGGNAYNVVETDASDLQFTGNTVKRFSSCLFPLADVYDANIEIKDNVFDEVCRGIVLWLNAGSDKDSDRYGFRRVLIANNECNIDMGYWRTMPRYDNIGEVRANRFAFLLTTAGNNKSVGTLMVRGNKVEYKNTTGAEEYACKKACINFESVGGNVLMMRCDTLEISGNRITNAVNRIVHNSMFQEIGSLIFNHNYINHPFSIVSATSDEGGGGVISLNASRAYAPSLGYPTVKHFTAIGNQISHDGYSKDDGCAVIVNSQLRAQPDYNNNTLEIKDNQCTSHPQYGIVRFPALKGLFGKVQIEN